uniref:Uncharacterized protein n=1 Tax=Arundo donax TaxID=35708 RepID=A0A0A9CV52_ARUDO
MGCIRRMRKYYSSPVYMAGKKDSPGQCKKELQPLQTANLGHFPSCKFTKPDSEMRLVTH